MSKLLMVMCFLLVFPLQSHQPNKSVIEDTYTITIASSKNTNISAKLFAASAIVHDRERRLQFTITLISNKKQNIIVVLDIINNTITVKNGTNSLGQLRKVTTKEISLILTSSNNETFSYHSNSFINGTRFKIFCNPQCTNFSENITPGFSYNTTQKPPLFQVTTQKVHVQDSYSQQTILALWISVVLLVLIIIIMTIIIVWLIRRKSQVTNVNNATNNDYFQNLLETDAT